MTMLSKTPQSVFIGNPVCHGCWDLILNLEGNGVMTADKQTLPFQEGTLFCVPPNVMHEKSSENGYTDIHIYTKTFLNHLNNRGILVLQDDELQTAHHLFMQMYDMYKHPTVVRTQLIEELLQVLLTWILLQHNASLPPDAVQEITKKLEQNYTDPALAITPLLQGYNYCPDYIRRLFKQYHGRSISEYLTELRLEHAKSLLHSYRLTAATIPQIALASGFSDPNYFSRVFKKTIRLTPLQYAKQVAG